MVYFILGIIFLTIILPVCEQVGSVICGAFEVIKAYLSLAVVKVNSKMQQYQQPEIKTNAIGFHIEEDYEDDEFL